MSYLTKHGPVKHYIYKLNRDHLKFDGFFGGLCEQTLASEREPLKRQDNCNGTQKDQDEWARTFDKVRSAAKKFLDLKETIRLPTISSSFKI